MKIEAKEGAWYTAEEITGTPIEGSERVLIGRRYGYRMPLEGKTPEEIEKLKNTLKSEGVEAELKISSEKYTGIPAGTQFLEVFDEKSAIALEVRFLKQGIKLLTDRFKEHGLEYINRTPKEVNPAVKKSIWDRLFGRK